MKNISIKAILVGIIALILLDGLGELALALVLHGRLDKSDIALFYSDTPFIYWRTLEALLALLSAGYITAVLAKSKVYLNSAIVGVAAMLLTIIGYSSDWHMVFAVIAFLTQIPFVLLGCYWFEKRRL